MYYIIWNKKQARYVFINFKLLLSSSVPKYVKKYICSYLNWATIDQYFIFSSLKN